MRGCCGHPSRCIEKMHGWVRSGPNREEVATDGSTTDERGGRREILDGGTEGGTTHAQSWTRSIRRRFTSDTNRTRYEPIRSGASFPFPVPWSVSSPTTSKWTLTEPILDSFSRFPWKGRDNKEALETETKWDPRGRKENRFPSPSFRMPLHLHRTYGMGIGDRIHCTLPRFRTVLTRGKDSNRISGWQTSPAKGPQRDGTRSVRIA